MFGTAFMHLLPHVEQDNLYRSMLNVPGTEIVKGTETLKWPKYNFRFKEPVKVFICPSDPSVDVSGVVTDSEMTSEYSQWGASSYALNVQVFCKTLQAPGKFGPIGHYAYESPPDGAGLFDVHDNRARLPATFPNGVSNTILFAEKYARCVLGSPSFNGGTYWAYWNAWNAPSPHPKFGPKHAAFGIDYFNPNAIGPNSKFVMQPNPYLGNCDPTRTSTGHTGGMQVVLADGSVRTLASSITGTTWWQACMPFNTVPLGPDW
jgi:hypothetical protein